MPLRSNFGAGGKSEKRKEEKTEGRQEARAKTKRNVRIAALLSRKTVEGVRQVRQRIGKLNAGGERRRRLLHGTLISDRYDSNSSEE